MFFDAKISFLLLLDSLCQKFVGRKTCVASHSIRDKEGTILLVVSVYEQNGDVSMVYDVADGINGNSLEYIKKYLKDNFLWRAGKLLLDNSGTTIYYLLVNETETAFREIQRKYGVNYEKEQRFHSQD